MFLQIFSVIINGPGSLDHEHGIKGPVTIGEILDLTEVTPVPLQLQPSMWVFFSHYIQPCIRFDNCAGVFFPIKQCGTPVTGKINKNWLWRRFQHISQVSYHWSVWEQTFHPKNLQHLEWSFFPFDLWIQSPHSGFCSCPCCWWCLCHPSQWPWGDRQLNHQQWLQWQQWQPRWQQQHLI